MNNKSRGPRGGVPNPMNYHPYQQQQQQQQQVNNMYNPNMPNQHMQHMPIAFNPASGNVMLNQQDLAKLGTPLTQLQLQQAQYAQMQQMQMQRNPNMYV